MTTVIQLPPLLRAVLLGAGIVVIAAGLHAAATPVSLVLLSFLIAFTVYPIAFWLTARGMKRGPAVMVTVLAVLVGGALLVTALAGALTGMVDKLPTYEAALSRLLQSVEARLPGGVDLLGTLRPDASRIVAFLGDLAGGALGGLGYSFLVLVLVTLILLELPHRRQGDAARGPLDERLYEVGVSVRRFVGLNGLVGAVQTAASLVAMWAFGTDFALVWAVLFFVLNFVPFGFAIGLVPPVVLTLLEHGIARALALLVILVVVNLIADNVVKPRVMGEGLGMSALEVVLSFMFWALVLGAMGAVLAIPLTIAIHKTLPILIGERA